MIIYKILKKDPERGSTKQQYAISNMQTAEKKNRSMMDNIIVINAIIDKQRQGHKNTNTYILLIQKMF